MSSYRPPSSRKRREQSQFARKVAAIKNEFKILLGTLDPVSAFNYLHYEGIVTKSDKKNFEQHLSTSETNTGLGKRTVSVSSVDEGKKPVKIDDKRQQAAREKLAEIVDQKDDYKEMRAIVIGLNAFKKLHQSAVDRRQTVQSQAAATLFEQSIFNQDLSETTTKKPVILPEEKLLAAFEQGTHSPEELIELLEESMNHCVISEVVNFEGKTLLHLACCIQPVEIVKTLVTEYSCDPNVQDNEGNTALHEASRCRKPIVTKFIVNLPYCNPNISNSAKETPLHLALRVHHWRLSKILLKSGKIDKTIENSKGETAFQLMERHPQSHEVARMKKLLERGHSVMSNTSGDSELISPPMTPTDSTSHRELLLHGQGSTATRSQQIQVAATTPVRPKTRLKGILRPYNPESIRTSQLETVLEGLDDSSAEQSEVSLDMDSCNLLAGTNTVTLTEKLSNACCYSPEIFVRIGYFLVAMVLCLIMLLLLFVLLFLT